MMLARRFRRDDPGVSDVIAVVLLVVMVIVLVGALYIWISGFSGSQTQPRSAAFTYATSGGIGTATLDAGSPQLQWSDVRIGVDGVASGTYGIFVRSANFTSFLDSTTASVWDGSVRLSATDHNATSGDSIRIGVSATPTGVVHVNVVDALSNTVISQIAFSGLTAQPATTTLFSACSGTTGTLTVAAYSKTGVDTAAIQLADVAKVGGAAQTDVAHAPGSTSVTFTPAVAAGNTEAAGPSALFDIAGAPIGTTTRACT